MTVFEVVLMVVGAEGSFVAMIVRCEDVQAINLRSCFSTACYCTCVIFSLRNNALPK